MSTFHCFSTGITPITLLIAVMASQTNTADSPVPLGEVCLNETVSEHVLQQKKLHLLHLVFPHIKKSEVFMYCGEVKVRVFVHQS